MPIVKNLTKQEIEKIQIDEGVCILDYGKTNERPLCLAGAAANSLQPRLFATLSLTVG